MRFRNAVLPIAVAALTLTAPAAQAAGLGVAKRKACYGTGDRVQLFGGGFTPNGTVAITRDGRSVGTANVNAQGFILGRATVPSISRPSQRSTYTATDTANAALVGSTSVKLARVRVRVRPARGNPRRVRKIGAAGFTTGRTLYVHVKRKRAANTIRLGRLRGACKRLKARARLFGNGVQPGTYRVQFDVNRRFRSQRAQRVVFRVRIFRRVTSAAAGTATGPAAGALAERWTRID